MSLRLSFAIAQVTPAVVGRLYDALEADNSTDEGQQKGAWALPLFPDPALPVGEGITKTYPACFHSFTPVDNMLTVTFAVAATRQWS